MKVPVVRITTPDAGVELVGLPLAATVAMADVAGAMRDGLLAFSTAAGLVVMQQMLTEELASIVGPKHRFPVRSWHARRPVRSCSARRRSVSPGPRGRYVDGGEVGLATSDTFASEDLLRQVVVERMLAGVATAAMSTSPNRSVSTGRHSRSRRCRAGSSPPPTPLSASCWPVTCPG